MQFIVRAFDGADMLEKRMAVRARHLENLAGIDGKVICAGGMLDEQGRMKGSVLILEFKDRAGLDAYLGSEPYVIEHVWEKVKIDLMNVVIVDGEKVGR